MLDFRTGRTLKLLAQTAPFIGLRLVVYLGIAIAYIVVIGIGAAVGALFGKIAGTTGGGAGIGGFIGFAVVSGILYWAREYLLYLVKAGHIAVLVQLLEHGELPEDKGQIAWGREQVQSRFTSTSVLFGVDRLVRGILKVFHRVTVRLAEFLPIPGLESAVKIFDAIIKTSLTNLDEVIVGQIFLRPDDSAWTTARDSVVLYAQSYKGILKNAVPLTFIVWGLTLALFVIVGLPLAALVALAPGVGGFWTFAVAIIIALCLKAALINPFSMAAMLQVYAAETRDKTPDPEWNDKLENMSKKFRELADKAGRSLRGVNPVAAKPTAAAATEAPGSAASSPEQPRQPEPPPESGASPG